MNQIKLVYGTPGNRNFSTPARKRELSKRAQRTKSNWFDIDVNEPITASDVFMSIGVYLAMPIMAFISVVMVVKVW